MVLVPEIKLIRTDTTLDLSQKAEKVCQWGTCRPTLQPQREELHSLGARSLFTPPTRAVADISACACRPYTGGMPIDCVPLGKRARVEWRPAHVCPNL